MAPIKTTEDPLMKKKYSNCLTYLVPKTVRGQNMLARCCLGDQIQHAGPDVTQHSAVVTTVRYNQYSYYYNEKKTVPVFSLESYMTNDLQNNACM